MFVILRSLTAKSHDIEFSAFVIWRMSSAVISKRIEFVIIKFVLYGKNRGAALDGKPREMFITFKKWDYLGRLDAQPSFCVTPKFALISSLGMGNTNSEMLKLLARNRILGAL